VERQPNYRRVDGKLVEIDPLYLATCDNEECEFFGYTVTTATFFDKAELYRYALDTAPYDTVTGRYKSAWERFGAFSNVGKDTPRSSWESYNYMLHAGRVGVA
jgi:hypothetical protein